MVRNYVLIGSEDALMSEMVPAAQARLTTEIDLANPISLKEITRAATQDLEREIILRVLQANGWNRCKTAKWLKISYRSLLYKLQEFNASLLPGKGLPMELADAFPPSSAKPVALGTEEKRKPIVPSTII